MSSNTAKKQSSSKKPTANGERGEKKSMAVEQSGAEKTATVEQRGGKRSTQMAQSGGKRSTEMAQSGGKRSTEMAQSGGKRSTEMAQSGGKKSTEMAQSGGKRSTEMAQSGGKKSTEMAQSGGKKSTEMAQSGGKKSITRDIKKWLRIIHRYLGFLMIGLALIYGVSGIILNHMGMSDPSYHSINSSINLDAGLSVEQVDAAWQKMADDLPPLKQVFEQDSVNYIVMIDGGVGYYNKRNGELQYEHHTKRQLVYWINKLHYNKVTGWSFMADFFAGALIFFAISGMFMVSKKHSLRGRGKWYVIAGLLIPILFIVLS